MSKYFETIRIENKEIFHLRYHQKRFERTSGLSLSLRDYIQPPQDGLYRCKLIYDESDITQVEYFPYTKREITSFRLVDIDFTYDKKYLDRSDIESALAKRGECDEVLMVKDGLVCDTSIANVAFFDSRRWLTPKKPLLEGTTRARYIEEGKLTQANIATEMLQRFSKMALLNAMIDFDIISIRNIYKGMIVAH